MNYRDKLLENYHPQIGDIPLGLSEIDISNIHSSVKSQLESGNLIGYFKQYTESTIQCLYDISMIYADNYNNLKFLNLQGDARRLLMLYTHWLETGKLIEIVVSDKHDKHDTVNDTK